MWHGDGMVWHHGMASWGAAGLDRNENRTIPPAASAVPCIWLGFDETSCRAAVDCDLSRSNKEGDGRATGGGEGTIVAVDCPTAAVKTEKEFPRAADCRGNTRSCFSPHRMWQLPCSELRHSRFLKLRQGNMTCSTSRREVGRTNTRGKNRVRTFFGDKVLTHLLAAPFMPSANACCQQRTYYLPTCNSGLFWVWAESFC